MAERKRIVTQALIQEPHPLPVGNAGAWTEDTAAAIRDHLLRVIKALNGYIRLGDGQSGAWSGNLDAQYIEVSFPAAPNTSVKIPHGLERAPVGYAVVRSDLACRVYDALAGSWGASVFYLQCDTASATVTVLVW